MDFSGLSSVAGNITSPFALFGIVVLAVVGIAKPVLSSAGLNNRARERLLNRIILAATVLALVAILAGLFVAPLQRTDSAARAHPPAAPGASQSVGGDNNGQIINSQGGDVQVTNGLSADQARALAERVAQQAVAQLREISAQNVALDQQEQAFTRQVETLGELLDLLALRNDPAADAVREQVEAGDFDTARRLLRESLTAQSGDAGDAALAAADATALGLMAEMTLDYDRATDYYRQAQQLAPDNGDALNRLGLLELERGHGVDAFDLFRRALAVDRRTAGARSPQVAYGHNNIGRALTAQGQPREALAEYEQALALYDAAGPGFVSERADVYNNLGTARHALDESVGAISAFEQSLVLLRRLDSRDASAIAIRLNNLASAWLAQGDSDKALAYQQQALALDRQVYGDRHPALAVDLSNLGNIEARRGEHDAALDHYGQALDIHRAAYGETHPAVATDLNNIAGVWQAEGRYAQAIDYYERALAIERAVHGEHGGQLATGWNNLGSAWYQAGDNDKAIGYYQRALAASRQALGPDHPDNALYLNNLGSAYKRLGDRDNAADHFRQAQTLLAGHFAAGHPWVEAVDRNLARLDADD